MVTVSKTFKFFSAYAGASFYQFSVGFSIASGNASIDLGFFWVSLEW